MSLQSHNSTFSYESLYIRVPNKTYKCEKRLPIRSPDSSIAHKIHKGSTTSVMNVISSSGARELLNSYIKLAATLRGPGEAWGLTSLHRTKV